MAASDPKAVLDALSVPFGDLIASVGRGVADAQRALDTASIAALQEVYSEKNGPYQELQRIGYRPNWYHIPEVEGEIQVALTVGGQETQSSSATSPARGPRAVKLYATPVDAGYASRFGFSLQATSSVKFRIVPVPPSSQAEAMQVMPALVGLTLAETRARLTLLGITATFPNEADTALVATQDPQPGTLLGPTTTVRIAV